MAAASPIPPRVSYKTKYQRTSQGIHFCLTQDIQMHSLCRCRSTFSTAPDITIASTDRGRVPATGKTVSLEVHGLVSTTVAVANVLGEKMLRQFCLRARQRLQCAIADGLKGWGLVSGAPRSWWTHVHAFEVVRTIVRNYGDYVDVEAALGDLNRAAVGFFFACAEAAPSLLTTVGTSDADDPILIIGAAALRTLLFTQKSAAKARAEAKDDEDYGGSFVLTRKHMRAIHAVLWVSAPNPKTSRDLLCAWLEALAQEGALANHTGAGASVTADTESQDNPASIQFIFCELLVKVCGRWCF